jgi:hypothetical protein
MSMKKAKGTRKIFRSTILSSTAAVILLILGTGAWAGDHGHRHGEDARIYGIIDKRPQDNVGVWTVNGRDVVVTENTRIKERHGKAEQGAYIEVEGSTEGKTFSAREIEVKQPKAAAR